jgi:class 3 adenylate cyclase
MQRRTGGRGLGAVLFTDIVGSTTIAAEMGNTRWGELLTMEVSELPVGSAVVGVGVEEASGSVWVYLDKTIEPAGG